MTALKVHLSAIFILLCVCFMFMQYCNTPDCNLHLSSNGLLVAADFDFQVFEFLSVDEVDFQRIKDDAESCRQGIENDANQKAAQKMVERLKARKLEEVKAEKLKAEQSTAAETLGESDPFRCRSATFDAVPSASAFDSKLPLSSKPHDAATRVRESWRSAFRYYKFSQFIMSYLTVDASQLVVSNGNYLDSLHSLQVKSISCMDVCGDLTIFAPASST
jgi:hypothetical protein